MKTTRIARRSALVALAVMVPATPALAVPADLNASTHHDSKLVRPVDFAGGSAAGPRSSTPDGGDGAPWAVFGISVGTALALGTGLGSLRPRRRVAPARAPRAA